MGILRFNYRSQAVGHYVDVTVVYPTDSLSYFGGSGGPERQAAPLERRELLYRPGMKFQTVYLIHGGGDDDSLTYRYTNAERYAQECNVMLVTPDVANSFGADTEYGVAYSTFLTQELPTVVQSLFASSPRREDNFIMGYAMGGNAALGSALLAPGRYSVCVDISGGIGFTVNTETLKEELSGGRFDHFKLYQTTFGAAERLEGSRHDVRAAALKNLRDGVAVPKLYLLAGSEEPDFIGNRIRADAEELKALGFDCTYLVKEGYGHDFDFWDYCIRYALKELLPLRRRPLYLEDFSDGE